MKGVYKIVNTITGNTYVGSSNDIERRFREHKCPGNYKRSSNLLYSDMTTYGIEKFLFLVIEETEKLREREQFWIDKINPYYNKFRAYQSSWTKEKFRARNHTESRKKWRNNYYNQMCFYNNEKIKMGALAKRFEKQGYLHPMQEAKKYLLGAR